MSDPFDNANFTEAFPEIIDPVDAFLDDPPAPISVGEPVGGSTLGRVILYEKSSITLVIPEKELAKMAPVANRKARRKAKALLRAVHAD